MKLIREIWTSRDDDFHSFEKLSEKNLQWKMIIKSNPVCLVINIILKMNFE